MGRHSTPDDDEPDVEVEAPQAPAATASRPRPGRHSQPADAPDDDERPVEDEALTDPAGLAPVAAPQDDGGSRGRIGLGKPRPGGVPRAAAARSGPPPREPADDDTSPGIALIERALAEDRSVEDIPAAREETVQITPIVDPVLDEPVPEAPTDKLRPVGDDDPPPAAESAAPPPARVSDVALLRADPAVRARVAAAVVVPFLLYVTVLLVLGSFDARTALIWIWIPLVTAGVVGGLILDLAHRSTKPGAQDGQRTSNPERTAP